MTNATLTTLCIVIPTRNRASLAINAIKSVLVDENLAIHVLVSDNSTEAEEVEMLRSFCAYQIDTRLTYVRPPTPLSMDLHWEWALKRALAETDISHVLYLTDRMVFKRHELQKILSAAKEYPRSVISYNHDGIDDSNEPVSLIQGSWTGKLYSIVSEDLLKLSSRMTIHHALPRMLSCIVPREVLDQVRERYGCVFQAIAPDFAFAYRCLERCDSILYLDRTSLVHYALPRSNGASQGSGTINKDHVDFLANLGNKELNYAAPVPAFRTVGNAIIHEYQQVKAQSGSAKFPRINEELYLQMIGNEINGIANPKLQSQMRKLLAEQVRHPEQLKKEKILKLLRFLFSWRSWWVKFWWIVTMPKFSTRWEKLRKQFNIEMSVREVNTQFDSVEEALKFASEHPRRRNPGPSYLESLVKFKQLPINNLESIKR